MNARHLLPLFLLVAVFALGPSPGHAADPTAVASARALGNAFASVAESAGRAVVLIQVEHATQPAGGNGTNPFESPRGGPFGGAPMPWPEVPQQPQPQSGHGTGFLIDASGLILTNAHVVENAARLKVRLEDGRELEGSIVGSDPQSDVAVVRVEGRGLPTLELADSDDLRVGEWVLAIGHPFGLTQSVTSGIVSAKGRDSVGITDYENFIQTDAAINPGNSGGPLLDLDGRVVGMNSAIYSRSGGYMGIGFAIPSNLVRAIKDQLVQHGSVSRGYLGVTVQDLTPDIAATMGMQGERGVLLSEVGEGSAAARAGLEVGDVVLSLDGRPMQDAADLRNAVALHRPGDVVELKFLRNGKRRLLRVPLGSRDGATSAPAPAPSPAAGWASELGFEVGPLTADVARSMGLSSADGVLVTNVQPGSLAARSGLASGTVVLEANRRPVDAPEDLRAAIENARQKQGAVLLRIRSAQGSRFLVLRLQ